MHFREQFYRHILQDLKKSGKTVLAVTHDDRYWGGVADRLTKLELGKIVEDRPQAGAGGGPSAPAWPG